MRMGEVMGKWKSILTLPHIFHKKVLLARFGKKDGRNFDRLVWVDYGYWTEDEDGKEYLFDGGEYSSLSDFGPTHWSEFPEFSEDSMTTQCEKAFEEWQESKLHETIGSMKEVWEAAAKWRHEFDIKICARQVVEDGIPGLSVGALRCINALRKAE